MQHIWKADLCQGCNRTAGRLRPWLSSAFQILSNQTKTKLLSSWTCTILNFGKERSTCKKAVAMDNLSFLNKTAHRAKIFMAPHTHAIWRYSFHTKPHTQTSSLRQHVWYQTCGWWSYRHPDPHLHPSVHTGCGSLHIPACMLHCTVPLLQMHFLSVHSECYNPLHHCMLRWLPHHI